MEGTETGRVPLHTLEGVVAAAYFSIFDHMIRGGDAAFRFAGTWIETSLLMPISMRSWSLPSQERESKRDQMATRTRGQG
ncbi:hypothetical protein [Rhodovarius lipocyclicus]|uniref:hypothetical protein n=1 Tax=Rhodovarius lipocyclicus TaxID=268410 RepID=UPI00191748D3|nr:hypothetical protein [Rhodovarius lipocyclicus]